MVEPARPPAAGRADTPARLAAADRAEALMSRHTIAEVQANERDTLAKIDGARERLRELVGGSHRDVISSAEAIVEMARQCKRVADNLSGMRSGLLARGGEERGWGEDGEGGRLGGGRAHAVGSRVKYLVDSSELIWSCLDSGEHLEATRRFLKARAVQGGLMEAEPGVLGRFPLLRHQAPNVEKMKGQIVEQVRQHLSMVESLPIDQSAGCLVSWACLTEDGCMELLDLLLNARREFLYNRLNPRGSDARQLGGVALSAIVRVIQDALAQVGHLFIIPCHSGRSAKESRLQAALAKDDLGYSGFLFGSLNTDGQSEEQSAEEAAWAQKRSEVHDRIGLCPVEGVAKVCSEWLKDTAGDILAAGDRVLSHCGSLRELAEVEAQVRSSVSSWSPPDGPSGSPRNGVLEERWGRLNGWHELIENVLDLRVDIWSELFEATFRRRVLGLVEETFGRVCSALEEELDDGMRQLQSGTAESAGGHSASLWSLKSDLATQLNDPTVLDALNLTPSGQAGELAQGGPKASGRPSVRAWSRRMADTFDKGVRQILEGMTELLEKPTAAPEQPGTGSGTPVSLQSGRYSLLSVRPGTNRPSTVKGPRAADLEPRLQESCEKAALALAGALESRLKSLPDVDTGQEPTASVEAALLVGNLCLEIGESKGSLGVLLGSSDEWRAQQHGGATPVRAARTPASFYTPRSVQTAKPLAAPENLQRLQGRFRAVAMQGFRTWAGWASAKLSRKLVEALQTDQVYRRDVAPTSWERVTLSHGEDDELGAAGGKEMHCFLPSGPSGGVMRFLVGACWELKRVGGHSVNPLVLQLFGWVLGKEACDVMKAELSEQAPLGHALSDTGILQLLLDTRFLQDVMAGAQPMERPTSLRPAGSVGLSGRDFATGAHGRLPRPPSRMADPQLAASLQEHKAQFLDLQSMLSERLDPIDWATYEPHLWQIEQRYYQRSAVLFGVLMQLNPLHSGPPMKSPSKTDTNILSMAPVAARFQYLPIRTPTPTITRKPSAQWAGSMNSFTNDLEASDPRGNYSFADLGSRRRDLDEQLEASSSSTFGSLGSLGTILGDKAAEVTALAQQRFAEQFGDFLQPAGTGLLSSLARGVGRATGQGT
eukprot:evm.model.scf_1054.1 EVM.evm.TU.scf_1054.1   scf_1054:34865-39269(-)